MYCETLQPAQHCFTSPQNVHKNSQRSGAALSLVRQVMLHKQNKLFWPRIETPLLLHCCVGVSPAKCIVLMVLLANFHTENINELHVNFHTENINELQKTSVPPCISFQSSSLKTFTGHKKNAALCKWPCFVFGKNCNKNEKKKQ